MTDPFKWIKQYIVGVSYRWPARTEAMKKARRPSKLSDKRTKWQYKCAHCKKWFKRKQVQLDHITPKGRYSKETFFDWLDKLFCPADGFQVLCKPCHKKKTANEHKTGVYK